MIHTDYISDPEFGEIHVLVRPQARRCVFRVAQDGLLQVSVPRNATDADVRHALNELRPRLDRMLRKVTSKREYGNTLVEEALREQGIAEEIERLRVVHSPALTARGLDEQKQNSLLLLSVLRKRAHQNFPSRIRELAQLHHFSYKRLRISSSRSRWGSCSSTGTISLSLWTAILPPHLQDYIMLHELCHTCHMNHSPQFWALLDKVSNGRGEELRREQSQWSIISILNST